MFNNFYFPDGSKSNWNSLDKLQKYFMKWFNKERTKSLLTFPVVTASCLNDGNELKDKDFEDFISDELSNGNSFFIFTSDKAHALSSCCRLKNDVSDIKDDFSYSLGAGGVQTGSLNVITLNINRLVQDGRDIVKEVEKIHKYQSAFRSYFEDLKKDGMLPIYDAGYINMDKQYLTIGVNGIVEAAEYLGFEINNNIKYKEWVSGLLKKISDTNTEGNNKYGYRFNTEFVPAENLGVKFAKWDKEDGYEVMRNQYNSYLYKVEDDGVSVLDKFSMHGKDTSQYLDGGSAYHCNLENYPTKEGFKKLLNVAVKEGTEYFTFNVKVTGCNSCGFIDKRTNYKCSKCGSKDIYHATRVIGYLKKVEDFSTERQEEEKMRYYSKV
jgi:ribonucleoside-triphosphate reductase